MSSFVQRLWGDHRVRYVVVAGTTTVSYLAILALLLTVTPHYLVAILATQVIIILCAFPAYRNLVFRSTGGLVPDFLRFLGVWSSGAVAGVVCTPFLVEVFGLPPLLAQVIAIVVVAVVTYLAHRYLTFRHHA